MKQSTALPFAPEVWLRQPQVRPFGRFWGPAAVLATLAAVVSVLLLTGLAAPRFSVHGGGWGSFEVSGQTADGVVVRHDVASLVAQNVSARPWTITGVRVAGDSSAASALRPGHTSPPLIDLPTAPATHLRVGVGEQFSVQVLLPSRG